MLSAVIKMTLPRTSSTELPSVDPVASPCIISRILALSKAVTQYRFVSSTWNDRRNVSIVVLTFATKSRLFKREIFLLLGIFYLYSCHAEIIDRRVVHRYTRIVRISCERKQVLLCLFTIIRQHLAQHRHVNELGCESGSHNIIRTCHTLNAIYKVRINLPKSNILC